MAGLKLHSSPSVVLGDGSEDIELSEKGQTVGTAITQLEDIPQSTHPLLKLLPMHISIYSSNG